MRQRRPTGLRDFGRAAGGAAKRHEARSARAKAKMPPLSGQHLFPPIRPLLRAEAGPARVPVRSRAGSGPADPRQTCRVTGGPGSEEDLSPFPSTATRRSWGDEAEPVADRAASCTTGGTLPPETGVCRPRIAVAGRAEIRGLSDDEDRFPGTTGPTDEATQNPEIAPPGIAETGADDPAGGLWSGIAQVDADGTTAAA